jgi:hypothetical protein
MIAESIYGYPYILKYFEDYGHIFTDPMNVDLITRTQKNVHAVYKLVSLKQDESSDPFCFWIVLNKYGRPNPKKELIMSNTDSSTWMLRFDTFLEELFKDSDVNEFIFYLPRNNTSLNPFFGSLAEFGAPVVLQSTLQGVTWSGTREVIDAFQKYKASI